MPLLSYSADRPELRTEVGVLTDGLIHLRSASGCGLYGPYIDLPAGPLVARITFKGPTRGYAHVDLAAEVGTRVLASRRVDFDTLHGQTVEIATILAGPLSACEVRLYCIKEVQATIATVEIEFGDYTAVERVIRSYLGGDRAKSIQKGRDIEAGYARGEGIEFGGLRQLILNDPDWIAAIRASRGRSIVTPERLMNLFLIMKYSDIQDGNIIEFGSFRGGSAMFLASLARRLRKNNKVFALDTYEGMPVTNPFLDRHRAGGFADVDLPGLEQARVEEGLDNLVLLRGLFRDTVETIAPGDRRFFLSHVDCDVYESVVFSIEFSKQYAVSGSYIVLDDPLTSDCLGAMQATEECLVQQGLFAEQAYPHLVFRYPAP